MALLVLIVLGSTLGWLASVLVREEDSGYVLRQVGIGLVATLAVGLFANSGTFLGGLSWVALGAGLAGGVVALGIHHLIVKRRADA